MTKGQDTLKPDTENKVNIYGDELNDRDNGDDCPNSEY